MKKMSISELPYDERRLPREKCASVLENICKRLDGNSEGELVRESPMVRSRARTPFRIVELWVYGSFARGAPHCGDLNLLIRIEPPIEPPACFVKEEQIAREYLTPPPGVNVKCIRADTKHLITGAILIWDGRRNWKRSIDSIPVNEAAGRYPRKLDAIPFRLEQLNLETDEAHMIVEARDVGTIAWQCFRIPEALKDGGGAPNEPAPSYVPFSQAGTRVSALVPHVRSFCRAQGMDFSRAGPVTHRDQTLAIIDGAFFQLGRPRPMLQLLTCTEVDRLVYIPFPSLRGPNRIWMIERGDNHPLIRLANSVTTYTVLMSGVPVKPAYGGKRSRARSAILFRTLEDAGRYIDGIRPSGNQDLTIKEKSGRELLSLLAGNDVVRVESARFALNAEGMCDLGFESIIKCDALLAFLGDPNCPMPLQNRQFQKIV